MTYYNSTAPYQGPQGQSTVTDQSLKLPDAISMESFQQYPVETFPEDDKCSTSDVVLKLDSTVNACWKIMTLTVLGKLPHI